MAITAAQVKELRESTGVGMMDCKKALTESNGDMDAAVEWLRNKGLAKAAKKAGRVAAEGLIGIASAGSKAAVVEVNSETDFVALNSQFQSIVSTVSQLALEVGDDVDAISAATYPGGSRTVAEELTEAISTIGENMALRRAKVMEVSEGVIGSYVHNATAEGLGKIGILVGLQSSGDPVALAALGKQVAMHIAATSPLAVTSDEVDPTVVATERSVFTEQAVASGKPEAIVEKMVEGRIRKFFQEVVLLSQTFVIDGENTVEKALELAQKDVGAPIKITGFVRFAIGEGIEKEESDFAAEVAATAGTA